MRAGIAVAEQLALPADDEDRFALDAAAEREAAALAFANIRFRAEKFHPFTPPILQIVFHSSAPTGETESRPCFTSFSSLSFGSALIAASVTGSLKGITGTISTCTNLPVLSLGSG